MKIAELASLSHPPAAPQQWPQDRDRMLAYLKGGRVIRAARSLAPDLLDPDRVPAVPITFQTDGEWIWPGAIGYYAERYDIPVDPELLEHARQRDFRIEPVDDAALGAALRLLDRTGTGAGSDAR